MWRAAVRHFFLLNAVREKQQAGSTIAMTKAECTLPSFISGSQMLVWNCRLPEFPVSPNMPVFQPWKKTSVQRDPFFLFLSDRDLVHCCTGIVPPLRKAAGDPFLSTGMIWALRCVCIKTQMVYDMDSSIGSGLKTLNRQRPDT